MKIMPTKQFHGAEKSKDGKQTVQAAAVYQAGNKPT